MEWTPGTKKQLEIIGRSWIEYMLIVEEIKGTYADLNSLYDVTNYAIKDKKSPGHTVLWAGSFNVFNITRAGDEFLHVKRYYNSFGSKLVRHFLVSFDNNDYITPTEAHLIACQICAFWADRFQVVFGVHQDTKYLHIHFVVNTTSFVDGKHLSDSYEDRAQFKKYVRKCYNQVRSESGRFINNFKRQERMAWG